MPVPGVQQLLDEVAALRRECRLDEARLRLRRAIELQTRDGGTSVGDAVAWDAIGDRLLTDGDLAGARASYERAIAIVTPLEATEATRLQMLLRQRGRVERRLGLLAEAQATHERAYSIAKAEPGTGFNSAIDELWTSVRDVAGAAAADERIAREGLVRLERAGRGKARPAAPPGEPIPCTPSGAAGVIARGGQGEVTNAGEVVAGLAGELRRCYHQLLAKQPKLQGSVRVLARIDAAGDPISAVAYVRPGDHVALAGCVAAPLAAAKFSPPRGGGATLVMPASFFPDPPTEGGRTGPEAPGKARR